MSKFQSLKHRLALVAGISLASVTAATAVHAMAAMGDDAEEQKIEKPEKKIRIVKAGEPNVIIQKDGKVLKFQDDARTKAITETRDALEKVEARLKKAKKGDEREALEAAKAGLEHALGALQSSADHMSFAFAHMPDMKAMRTIEIKAMEEALADMEIHMKDFDHIRVEISEDLAEAQEDIAEAMTELEFEFNFDDEMREEHARSLEEARKELGRAEERQLEGLKRAEEQLKRERERLERKLEERRRQLEEEAPVAPSTPE